MNQDQQDVGSGRPPQTFAEALQIVKVIPVPAEVYVAWMRRLAPVPSQFAGGVYDSMDQLLASAIAAAAAGAIERRG